MWVGVPYTTSRLGPCSVSYEQSHSLLPFICWLDAEDAAGDPKAIGGDRATRVRGPGAPDCCVEQSSSPIVSHWSGTRVRKTPIPCEAAEILDCYGVPTCYPVTQ